MAHFARLNGQGVVEDVVVVNNNVITDENGIEHEEWGISFLQGLLGPSVWKQTSYNRKFRKNYAGLDYIYDENLDAFIPPKPFASWSLNTETCRWEAPVPYPNDDQDYYWDDSSQAWIQM
jgi:hypothetical protein